MISLGFVVCLAAVSPSNAEDRGVTVRVVNLADEPLQDVVLASVPDGLPSRPTTNDGSTLLSLPRQPRVGEWIYLKLVAGPGRSTDWILVSPWDARAIVTPSGGGRGGAVSVVIARKGDKDLLITRKGWLAIVQRLLLEAAPTTLSEVISEDRRRAALMRVSEVYGVNADDLDHEILARQGMTEAALRALWTKNYVKAEELLTTALAIREGRSDGTKAEAVDIARFLGQCLYQQGKYSQAAEAYRKATDLRPDDATMLNEYALAVDLAENYGEAERLFRRALSITEKESGSESPDVVRRLINLGMLLYSEGRYQEAEPLFKRSLAITERTAGAKNAAAECLNNLATVYYALGRSSEAEQLYDRALAISENLPAADQAGLATSLSNLAELYRSRGRYPEAEVFAKRSLAIAEKAFGADHPGAAASLNNLAEIYRSLARDSEAELLLLRSLAIREKAQGANHRDLAATLNNLAALYRSQGRYDDAEPLFKRALAIR